MLYTKEEILKNARKNEELLDFEIEHINHAFETMMYFGKTFLILSLDEEKIEAIKKHIENATCHKTFIKEVDITDVGTIFIYLGFEK